MKILTSLMLPLLMLSPALSGAVMAEEKKHSYLNFGGASHHFSDEKFTENNYGLGLEVPMGGYLVGLGAYKNSLGRTSRYIVAEKCIFPSGPICLGALSGFVDGYYLNGGNFIPMVAPTVTVDMGSMGLRLIYAPEIDKSMPAVVSIQLRLRIN